MARTCVFCGARNPTREDVFERQINTILGVRGEINFNVEGQAAPARPPHPTLDVVVRATCQHCNNVWLNGIWMRFRDLMSPAMRNGASVTLSAQGQMDVSMWAVKTALLLQMATRATRPDPWLPMNHFPYLRREGQPPPGTEIRLFRVDAQNTLAAWHKSGVLGRERGGPPTAHVVTFTVGYLGVHVLSRKIVETRKGGVIFDRRPIEPPSAFNGVFRQILPVTGIGITWPPPLFVKMNDLSALTAWPVQPG